MRWWEDGEYFLFRHAGTEREREAQVPGMGKRVIWTCFRIAYLVHWALKQGIPLGMAAIPVVPGTGGRDMCLDCVGEKCIQTVRRGTQDIAQIIGLGPLKV